MLIRLKDLKGLSARTRDGSRHKVVDLFVRHDDLRATHVLIRLGRWFDRAECALRIRTMGRPDLGEGVWPTGVDEAQVRAAPKVEDGPGTTADAAGDVALVATEGTTLAADAMSDEECALSEARAGDLIELSKLIDAPVRDASGARAGTVMDFVLDADRWAVALLVVHEGQTGGEHQRVVPMAMVDRVSPRPAAVTLRCDAGKVADAPDLHESGLVIEGSVLNRVMSYYGLG